MIIGKDEKAKIWEKNGGKCGICSKSINPFNEVIFHAFNGRKIEMYCSHCESTVTSANMNDDSLDFSEHESAVDAVSSI